MNRLHFQPRFSGSKTRQQGHVGWFILVGCTAAAVHWGMVALLVTHAGFSPLLANVMGWITAVGVSFTGHHLLSFRGHQNALKQAIVRFVCISAGGFLLNEASYALLLHFTTMRYDILLALVLVGVAVATYLLSRHWAFLRS